MRTRTLFFILMLSFIGYGQKDTIQVSTQSAIVIFPKDIANSFLGDDITFFMGEKDKTPSMFSNRIVKLYYSESPQARNRYTHLTVITVDGNSYEFTLEYSKRPKQDTWYIEPEQAIKNILGKRIATTYQSSKNPDISAPEQEKVIAEKREPAAGNMEPDFEEETTEETATPTDEMYETNREEYKRLRCYYMQFDKPKIARFYDRDGDIFLWLKGVYYNKEELYVQLKLENKTGVDFDVKFANFSIATSYKGSSSNQKNPIAEEKIYRYKIPSRVKANTENHFVIAFDKFSLDRNRVLVVDVDEENGNRNLSLEIDNDLINNPFKLK